MVGLAVVGAVPPLYSYVILSLGCTLIVNVFGAPGQIPCGVAVIVAIIGALLSFFAVNEGKFPFPEEFRPMLVFEFVQVTVALVGFVANVMAGTVCP